MYVREGTKKKNLSIRWSETILQFRCQRKYLSIGSDRIATQSTIGHLFVALLYTFLHAKEKYVKFHSMTIPTTKKLFRLSTIRTIAWHIYRM